MGCSVISTSAPAVAAFISITYYLVYTIKRGIGTYGVEVESYGLLSKQWGEGGSGGGVPGITFINHSLCSIATPLGQQWTV